MFGIVGKVYAQCDYSQNGIDLGRCLLLKDSTPVADVYTSPAFLVNLLVRNIFVIGGVILFLLIFWAGFKFVQGGAKGKDEAKQIVTSAAAGAVIMFSAYWIVQIIQVLTGVDVGL